MQVANIADDSTFGLELEKIRKKIATLYESLLLQVYRAENPGASPEEIQAFLEENALDFPEVEEDSEEIDALLEMIDNLGDDLDPVDKDGKSPDVEQGKEPKSKSHEKGDTPDTQPVPIQTGMLNTPADQRVKTRTRKQEDPTGTQKHSKTHERQNILKKETIHAILDKERQRLLRLVEARNKEMGVIV